MARREGLSQILKGTVSSASHPLRLPLGLSSYVEVFSMYYDLIPLHFRD